VCEYVQGLLPLEGAELRRGETLMSEEIHGGCVRA
jgi:hypothetical protein